MWAVPRASRSAIEGVVEGRVRIRLAAPPQEGAANAELVRLLADVLEVPRSSVAIMRGAGSRAKTVAVRGVAVDDVRRRLGI